MALNLFVPLDVDFQSDPKIIAAGVLGEALFNRSLALSKRTLSDGRIDRTQLPGLCLGIPGKPGRHADTLVTVGLWTTIPSGWQIAAWAKRNQSSKAVIDKADRKRAAGLKANHERWHVGENGKPSESCALCYPDAIRTGSDPESPKTEVEEEEEPQEEEEEETVVGSSTVNSRQQRSEPDDDDVAKRALTIVADIRTTREHPANPKAYRAKIIANGAEHLDDLRLLADARPDATAAQVAEAFEAGGWKQLTPTGASKHPAYCACEGNHSVPADPDHPELGYRPCTQTDWPDADIIPIRGAS